MPLHDALHFDNARMYNNSMTDTQSLDSRILLVEDTASLSKMYETYLTNQGYQVKCALTAHDALTHLQHNKIDLILLDLKLPDMSGLDVMRELKNTDFAGSVIVITGNGSINTAVEAMREGARDFLVKPFNVDRLGDAVQKGLSEGPGASNMTGNFTGGFGDTRTIPPQGADSIGDKADKPHLKSDEERMREVQERQNKSNFGGFIGTSAIMQALYTKIENAALSQAPVFITGESGTGKEVCAEAIHKHGPRSDKPFVPINCAAIPKDLIESEMLGHVKGAFTGAIADRDGAAKLADGGTLFLDEIGETDPSMQSKLLRFLQNYSFRKVGGSKMETTDVRIICATNRNPIEQIKNGGFREDLYYRLHVIPIDMPPLRARDHDVIDIAEAFLWRYAAEEKKDFKSFSEQAENMLRRHMWPGNIRELQNLIRQIIVMHNGQEVTPDMIPPFLNSGISPAAQTAAGTMNGGVNAGAGVTQAFSSPQDIRPLWIIEKEIIENAIDVCRGNIPKAAAMLEISPSTIYRKKMSWDKMDEVGGNDEVET